MTKLKTLVAGVVLATAIVPFSAAPAQACGGVQCILNCVHNFAHGKLVCQF